MVLQDVAKVASLQLWRVSGDILYLVAIITSSTVSQWLSDLQTLICVLVARPRRCSTLSNPVP